MTMLCDVSNSSTTREVCVCGAAVEGARVEGKCRGATARGGLAGYSNSNNPCVLLPIFLCGYYKIKG